MPRNVAVQVGGQLIPAGLLVTEPSPAPAISTETSFTPRVRPWHPKRTNIDTVTAAPAANRQRISKVLFNANLDEAGAELVGSARSRSSHIPENTETPGLFETLIIAAVGAILSRNHRRTSNSHPRYRGYVSSGTVLNQSEIKHET